MICTMHESSAGCACAFGLTYKVGEMRVGVTLSVLCTATCRVNLTSPPPPPPPPPPPSIMSKQVYVYDWSSSEQLMRQDVAKTLHEGIHELFEQF